MRWCGLVTVCMVAAGAAMTGCLAAEERQPFDASRVHLLQMEPLMEGEDIAVLATGDGEIHIRFFPSEAPLAVQNFKLLAKEGFYNGKELCGPESQMKNGDHLLLSGALAADTMSGVSRVNGGKPFQKEISANLWHFSGAVSVLGNKSGRGDSRFFITGTQEVTNDVLDDLTNTQYPPLVIDAFREVGGAPEYSLDYSVFGQVVAGQPVVDRIIERVRAGNGGTVVNSVELVVYNSEQEDAQQEPS